MTPVIAALAGAEVTALAKQTDYGNVDEIFDQTRTLADSCGVWDRIEIVESLDDRHLASVDIVTNSGHLRPLDANRVSRMRPGAVIPLMYESWELRASDVDLDACRRRGVRVGGTNERHPAVGVFDYLGLIVVKTALCEGHCLIGERCLVISDNDFGKYVHRSLEANGATVYTVRCAANASREQWDIVVIATTPPLCGGQVTGLDGLDASLWCQLWGDVERPGATGVWSPRDEPKRGHMGIGLSVLGPTPVVKLQAGGLKCGELMLEARPNEHIELVQWVVGP